MERINEEEPVLAYGATLEAADEEMYVSGEQGVFDLGVERKPTLNAGRKKVAPQISRSPESLPVGYKVRMVPNYNIDGVTREEYAGYFEVMPGGGWSPFVAENPELFYNAVSVQDYEQIKSRAKWGAGIGSYIEDNELAHRVMVSGMTPHTPTGLGEDNEMVDLGENIVENPYYEDVFDSEVPDPEEADGLYEYPLTEVDFVIQNEGLMRDVFESLPAWGRVSEAHSEDTPRRFLKMMHQMTTREEFNFTTFPNDGGHNMVHLGPISFYTMCAHHTAPFFGEVYIGYIPDKRVAGLSKFARAVKYLAKGFWVQEEFTDQLHDYLVNKLDTYDVMVVVQAEHLCMSMRGVQERGVVTTTSAVDGVFEDKNETTKAEFMDFVKMSKR